MPPRAALGAALLVLAVPAARLRAQAVCDGRPIRAIQIDARNIFSPDDSLIPGFVRGLGNALHWRTRVDIVALDLLFAVNEPCDPRRLRETERLLRARGYIRSAVVVPVATADGGVEVLVQTRDEFSLRGGLQISGGGDFPVKHFNFGEENVLGRGMHFQTEYSDLGRRASYETGLRDDHFFGRRIEAEEE